MITYNQSQSQEYLTKISRVSTVLTSGGFDLIHPGHLNLLNEGGIIAKTNNCRFVVVVNGDGFLQRKKGYNALKYPLRAEIIAAHPYVNDVIYWDDDTQFVDGVITLLRPAIFVKGGDRSSPEQCAECELKACKDVNCEIRYGVGGADKQYSSSDIYKNMGCALPSIYPSFQLNPLYSSGKITGCFTSNTTEYWSGQVSENDKQELNNPYFSD